MKRALWLLASLWLLGAPAPALSQAENFLVPAGGLTVKDLIVRNSGWAFVTFQEDTPELNVCEPTTFGNVTYAHPLWLEFSGTYQNAQAAKITYATLLAAYMTGRKVAAVNWRKVSTWCDAFTVRMGP